MTKDNQTVMTNGEVKQQEETPAKPTPEPETTTEKPLPTVTISTVTQADDACPVTVSPAQALISAEGEKVTITLGERQLHHHNRPVVD